MAEMVVRVTDRTWEFMLRGAEFEAWPGGEPPRAGSRVCIFDRDDEFTRHDVLRVEGRRVWIGPAIPWSRR
jgi:hypothetical protein